MQTLPTHVFLAQLLELGLEAMSGNLPRPPDLEGGAWRGVQTGCGDVSTSDDGTVEDVWLAKSMTSRGGEVFLHRFSLEEG